MHFLIYIHTYLYKHSHHKNRVSNGTLAYAITDTTSTNRPLDELSSESNLQILPHSTITTTAVIQRTKLV